MFGFTIYKFEQATDNLRAVQMMILAKLGHTMARVDTLDTWIPYIQKMEKRIEELEKQVAEMEKKHNAGPWG